MHDLKFAARQMLKNKGFTAIALLTLALGIGATTSIFSVINALLLNPLPYSEPGRLVYVWEAHPTGSRNAVSGGAFQDWVELGTQCEGLSVISGTAMNLTGGGTPEGVTGWQVSANFLSILRVNPILGRGFLPGEDRPGQDNRVVLLSHGFWMRRFGGDKEIVGREISLNQDKYTVVGVLPERAIFSDQAQFLIPFVVGSEPWHQQRGDHRLQVIGRLKPGVTLAQAESDLASVKQRRQELYPTWKEKWSVAVVSAQEEMTREIKPTLLVLLAAIGAVLLIGCANIAGLLLAKAAARQREIAIRSALGATTSRILKQVLTESVLLAVLGGGIGAFFANWGTEYLSKLSTELLPRAPEIHLDGRVLLFSLAVSMGAGVLFGIFPALRLANPALNSELREGGRGSTSGTTNRVQGALVVAEVALSLVLLSGAGLLLKSFVRLQNVPLGFDARNTLAMDLSLPEKKYPTAERRAQFLQETFDRLNSLPGVEASASTTCVPMLGWSNDSFARVPGREHQPDPGYDEQFDFVGGDFFKALRIPLMSGRYLERHDNSTNAPRAIVIDEAAAKEIFPNENSVGKQIQFWDQNWEVVGVVGTIRHDGLDSRLRGRVYLPQVFCPWTGSLLIRTAGNPLPMTEAIRKAILQVDPDQPISNIRTIEQAIVRSVASRRFTLILTGIFAYSALALAAIGLYGLMAYFVAQRTQEIGIRIALGAQRREVITMILKRGMRLTGLGVALGLIGSLAVTRFMASQLFEVESTDPGTFASCVVILSAVALLGCWFPTYRASKIDPMEALRS